MSTRLQTQALSAALDLLRIPSKARAMRLAPLPAGVLLLLRLAAEDAEARSEADKIDKRAPDAHREAAIFFIEQILLSANADSHRMLGLNETATTGEMRRHMAYLLKWLHPDRNTDPHKALLARRVLLAWSELKHSGAPKRDRAGSNDERRKTHDVRSTFAPTFASRRVRNDRGTRSTFVSWLSNRLMRRVRPL